MSSQARRIRAKMLRQVIFGSTGQYKVEPGTIVKLYNPMSKKHIGTYVDENNLNRKRHNASTNWVHLTAEDAKVLPYMKVRLVREHLDSGGYTKCGRYFGSGLPLYSWQTEDSLDHQYYESGFTRGRDREDAKDRVIEVIEARCEVTVTFYN